MIGTQLGLKEEAGGHKKENSDSAAARRQLPQLSSSNNTAATHLHYDFRLEINGVMKSWAIPKGPSLNPSERRLAVLTKDHSLAYNRFEGVIPKGEYGAGTVIIWDRGRYRNLKKNHQGTPLSMESCFRKGTIEVHLNGKKMKGGFALVRMSGKNWLLIKMKDQYANTRKNLTSIRTLFRQVGKNTCASQKEKNQNDDYFI